MKKILPILFLLLFVTAVANAADRYAVSSGNWNSTATWSTTSGGASGASAPTALDNVFIEGGFTVSITSAVACNNLTIGTGTNGILTFNSTTDRALTVTGFIFIASGSSLTTANASGVNAHSINVAGDVTNNGTLDCITNDDVINFVFNGAANQNVSGSGATTDFNGITINNSGAALNNIVEFTTSDFSNTGLTMTDGILKFSTPNTLTSGSLTLGAAVGIELNNASAVLNNSNDYTVNGGSFVLTSGTWSNGNGNDDFIISGGTATFSGGTLNVGGRFQR